MPRSPEAMPDDKNYIIIAASFAVSMVWYILLTFAVTEIFDREWPAYALAVYLSGFLEVGMEKCFYVKTYKSKRPIYKSIAFLPMAVIPMLLGCLFFAAADPVSRTGKIAYAFLLVTLGTVLFRIIYTAAEGIIRNKRGK